MIRRHRGVGAQLGYADAMRFLHQFGSGHGDYTAERTGSPFPGPTRNSSQRPTASRSRNGDGEQQGIEMVSIHSSKAEQGE